LAGGDRRGGDRFRGITSLLAYQGLENGDTPHHVRLEDLVRQFWKDVFQAHIKEILGLKRLESTSAVSLRDFSDKSIGRMRALQALGDLRQISGCTVVYMIV